MAYAFVPGDPPAICDRCGFKYHLSQLRKEWTGFMVCHGPGTNDCWEPRHPQEFVRGVRDRQHVPNARPEPPDNFITTPLLREDGSFFLRERPVLETIEQILRET